MQHITPPECRSSLREPAEKSRLARCTDLLLNFFYLLLTVWVLDRLLNRVMNPYDFSDPDSSFYDFLFNYSAGFIRRGLNGEILFALHNWFGIPPTLFVTVVSLACFAIISWFLVKNFIRKGMGLQVLLASFALGALAQYGFDFMRRDYMELALLLAVIYSYKNLSVRRWLILGNALMIFGMLLHEGTFFHTVPALIILTYLDTDKFWKSCLAWSPCILTLLICCIFKGTPADLPMIEGTARDTFPALFQTAETPQILAYIAWDKNDVFKMVIHDNITGVDSLGIPAIVYTLALICYVGFLAILMPVAFARKRIKRDNVKLLTTIMLFQLISLLPMLLLFSIDFSRDMLYWVISSYIIYFGLNERESVKIVNSRLTRFIPALGKRTTRYVQSPISKIGFTLLLIMVGIPFVGRTLELIKVNSYWYESGVINSLKSLLS